LRAHPVWGGAGGHKPPASLGHLPSGPGGPQLWVQARTSGGKNAQGAQNPTKPHFWGCPCREPEPSCPAATASPRPETRRHIPMVGAPVRRLGCPGDPRRLQRSWAAWDAGPLPDRGRGCSALAAVAELCRAPARRGEHAARPGWQRRPSCALLMPSPLERPPEKPAGTERGGLGCGARSPNNSLSSSSVSVSHFPHGLEIEKKQEERKGKPPGPRAREQLAPGNKSVMPPGEQDPRAACPCRAWQFCAGGRHRQPPRKETKGDVGTPAP